MSTEGQPNSGPDSPRPPETAPVAIVTGAGSGIGRATSLRFLADGIRVLGVDLSAEGLAETARLGAGAATGTFASLIEDVAADQFLTVRQDPSRYADEAAIELEAPGWVPPEKPEQPAPPEIEPRERQ